MLFVISANNPDIDGAHGSQGDTDDILTYQSVYESGNTIMCLRTVSYLTSSPAKQLGLVAWSDARLPGMRMVAGSILTSGNILSWRLVMK